MPAVRQPEPLPVGNSPTCAKGDEPMETQTMLDSWNEAERYRKLAEEAHDVAVAGEFETFRELFETFPSTVVEAAALFERFAQPLNDDDDFTVIEHAIELWKGGGGHLPAAKEWASRMAGALNLIAVDPMGEAKRRDETEVEIETGTLHIKANGAPCFDWIGTRAEAKALQRRYLKAMDGASVSALRYAKRSAGYLMVFGMPEPGNPDRRPSAKPGDIWAEDEVAIVKLAVLWLV